MALDSRFRGNDTRRGGEMAVNRPPIQTGEHPLDECLYGPPSGLRKRQRAVHAPFRLFQIG
jgi:hypothetical protein